MDLYADLPWLDALLMRLNSTLEGRSTYTPQQRAQAAAASAARMRAQAPSGAIPWPQRQAAPQQMGAAGAAYATLMADPSALRWRTPPSAPGPLQWPPPTSSAQGGPLPPLPDALSSQGEAYVAQLRSQQFLSSLSPQGAAGWLRSLPDGYGIERALREAAGMTGAYPDQYSTAARRIMANAHMSAADLWRLANKGERAQNVAAAIGFLLGGAAQYSILRTPGVGSIEALLAAGS